MDRNERKTSKRNVGNRTRGAEKRIQKYKKKVTLLSILCGVLLVGNLVLVGRFVIWEKSADNQGEELVYVGPDTESAEAESGAIDEADTDSASETNLIESESETETGMAATALESEEETIETTPETETGTVESESESGTKTETETETETDTVTSETGNSDGGKDSENKLTDQLESIFEKVFAGETGACYRLIGLGELGEIEVDSTAGHTITQKLADTTEELGELYLLGAMYAKLTEEAVVANDLPDLRTLAEVMMRRTASEGTDRAGEAYSLSSEEAAEELLRRLGGQKLTETEYGDTDFLQDGLDYVASFCRNSGFSDTLISGFSGTETNKTSLADVTDFFVKLYETDSSTGQNGLSMSADTSYSFQRKLEEILGTDYADGREKSALVSATLASAEWTPASDVLSEEEYSELDSVSDTVTEAGYYYPNVMWVSESADDQSAEYTVLMVLFDSSGADVRIRMDSDEAPDYDSGYVIGVFDSNISDPSGWGEKMENLAEEIYELMRETL
ncbi:MAG: hypothetical protein LUD16_06965 [Lachnospiraceae bacterium]|nr:hypothetical protein [Lachnospiraceae bacterium]